MQIEYKIRPALRILFVLTLMIASSAKAFAADLISSRSYWEDASNQASFAQAQAQDFESYSGVLSRGFSQSAIWIRLEVLPPLGAKADEKLILRIRPIYLDEITLFDPLDDSGDPRIVGDRSNYRDEEYKSLTHTFVIPAGNEARYVWLRLKTSSTSMINVEAFTPVDMLAREYQLLIGYCLVLSLVMVFLILVFINWLNYREPLYAVFVVRHLLYFVYTASFFGFHRYFLDGLVDAKFLDLIYNWVVVGTTGFSIWFESRFLREYSPPKWAKWTINSLLVWSACAATLLLFGEIQQALKINMLLNGVGIVVLLIVASAFIDDEKAKVHQVASLLKKRVVVTYYASITALLIFSVLPYVGAIAGNEFSINGLVFYALCSGMVMTLLMQMRANQLRKANIQYQQDLVLASQHRELEQKRLEEQSQLLTMLMHEIKTPLSVIDLAQQSTADLEAQGYVARNVKIIKNILNRCLNADRVALGKLNVNLQSVAIESMLIDLREQHTSDKHRIEIHISPEIKRISTDYQCLEIILNNLLDNALRYGDAAQPIQVNVARASNSEGAASICLTVSNKTGIASWPDPSRVFHKYYRSPGAQAISGTGLGLFLVASMAKILGGTCTYAPDETNVRFELWLPS